MALEFFKFILLLLFIAVCVYVQIIMWPITKKIALVISLLCLFCFLFYIFLKWLRIL